MHEGLQDWVGPVNVRACVLTISASKPTNAASVVVWITGVCKSKYTSAHTCEQEEEKGSCGRAILPSSRSVEPKGFQGSANLHSSSARVQISCPPQVLSEQISFRSVMELFQSYFGYEQIMGFVVPTSILV